MAHFLPWLHKNCHVGERQAQNYMTIAAKWGAIPKSAVGSDLTIKQALRLIGNAELPKITVGGFPFPRLVPCKLVVGLGRDSVAMIWHRDASYYFVAIYKELGTGTAHVVETKQPIIDYAVPLVLKLENVTLSEPWRAEDSAIVGTPAENDHQIWMIAADLITQRWRKEAGAIA